MATRAIDDEDQYTEEQLNINRGFGITDCIGRFLKVVAAGIGIFQARDDRRLSHAASIALDIRVKSMFSDS